jgi:uncharacterized membrane protein
MSAFLFLIVVLLAIWIARSASKIRKTEARLAQLTTRIYSLEQQLKQRRVPVAEPPVAAAPAAQPTVSVPVEPPPLPPQPEAAFSGPIIEPQLQLQTSPSFSFRKLLNLEETLGTNWLNKLGIVILVIGVALFLAYEMRELGAIGKIVIGYAVSAVMLAAGIFFERRDQWRILARAGIAGGWSLLYFTTYAMYHVPAARVLHSEGLDLILLLLTAAGMVIHTLRYDSQVVTGLAFLLALTTINISRGNVYGLIASAFLVAGLTVVTLRRRWFEMEIAGMAAAYLNHYLWLRPIIEPMHGHVHTFPGYFASSALLYSYWLVFRASYVLRKVETRRAEQISTIAAILNVVLFGMVMGYQSIHPELAFQFFVAIGAVELAVGQLPITRRRRAAFVVLTTLGSCLLVMAVPYRYSGEKLSSGWLAEAEALLLVGVFLGEVVFRRLGLIAAVVTWIQMIASNAAPLWNDRLHHGDNTGWPGLASLFTFAALIFYLNSQLIPRRWPEVLRKELDRLSFSQLAHLAGVLALIGTWIAWPGAWTAVAWAALATALAFTGQRWQSKELSLQAPICAAAAVVRVLAVNLSGNTTYPHIHWLTARLVTVSLVIALLYLGSRWASFPGLITAKRVSASYTWAASILAGFLVWYELQPIAVVLGWSLIALILFEAGLHLQSPHLRLQAYLGFTASFLRLFVVNLNAVGQMGQLSARVYTIVPLALVFYYVYARLAHAGDDSVSLERRRKLAGLHCFYGTLALAALLRFELDADLVAAAWSLLVLLLIVVAWKTGRRIFLDQGLLLAFCVLLRGILHNLYERSHFPAPFGHGPFVSLGSAVALLFLVLPLARALRRRKAEATHYNRFIALMIAVDRRPDLVFFFVPFVLLTALLAVELPIGMVTLAWGIEAFAVFAVALWLKERSYRLSALALLLLCVMKIVFRDVWGLAPRDRYLTFIVLGSALLAVSYLYTRFREVLRQYL